MVAGALARHHAAGCPTFAPWRAAARCGWRIAKKRWPSRAKTAAAGRLPGPQRAADPAADRRARTVPLRSGLAGGLWVPGDGIVYAPNVARWLVADAGDHSPACATARRRLPNHRYSSPAANGYRRGPSWGLRPQRQRAVSRKLAAAKKGQLAITDRYGPRVHHQLVESGLRRQRLRRRHLGGL